MLAGGVADRNGKVPRYRRKLINRLRRLRADIDANFVHHRHGSRVESMSFNACGRNVCIREVRSCEAGSHLTAAAIACAKEKDVHACKHREAV